MATGCRAFAGNSTASIFAAILHSTPISPSRLNPSIPREFDRVVARLVEKSPEARHSTARELLAALQVVFHARSGRLTWLNSGTPACRIAQGFDNLRCEPRFERLLERIHLPA